MLHVFHAFTGCDQTSAFLGRRKSTAWATWISYGEATSAFTALCRMASMQDVLNAMPVLGRFVVLLYDRTSPCQGVNDARKVLFAQKGRTLENIPPTADTLVQHTKRVAYQAGHCWGQCMVLILSYLLQVNGDGHDSSQIHGSLSGPHYLKHQKYARSW